MFDCPKPTGNRIINLRRVTDLAGEPVTLAEAKEKLRVTFTDDDTEITALITRARRFVEEYCNISIVYQRIELIAQLVEEWTLPWGPVIGIETVQDSQGQTGSGPVSYESSTRNWWVDGDQFNPAGWGEYKTKLVYTAGGVCPADLKEVILEVIVFLYENRGRDVKITDLQTILTNADTHKVMLWI